MVTYLPAETSNKKSAPSSEERLRERVDDIREDGGVAGGDDLAPVRSGLERGAVGGETEFVALPVGHVTARVP